MVFHAAAPGASTDNRFLAGCLVVSVCLWPGAEFCRGEQPARQEQVWLKLADAALLESARPQDAQLQIVPDGDQAGWLEVRTGHQARWPGVTLPAPGGAWDLSSARAISLRVFNPGNTALGIHCRVDSPGGDGTKHSVTERVEVPAGGSRKLRVPLRRPLPQALADRLFGMRGYPGGLLKDQGVDASQITQLILYLADPSEPQRFRVSDVSVESGYESPAWLAMPPDEFFPMIDSLGQFKHRPWPGKVVSPDELPGDIALEQSDWAAHPGPKEWNAYGGWAAGPQLPATGFFYTKEIDGWWWLVDPLGHLFWSHGVDCVGLTGGTTPITDREFYFEQLPDRESPLTAFYGQASWAPHNYYEDKGTYRTFGFGAANLMRKYGPEWQAKAADASHRRLRSWGLNTIGNWSDGRIYTQQRTPYVVAAGTAGQPIEGSSGYWGKFPDPFHPSMRDSLRRRMESERERTAGDPWCIGFFVDNELGWGDEISLALATLASPAEQAAKQVMVAELQERYTQIERLNAQWGTSHANWEALLASRTPPDRQRAWNDLTQFYTRIAEEYFRICREEVHRVAPNQLYLGCRFAWVNPRGARAAAKYCDVIGYNLYEVSVADFQLPSELNKPVIIGEFHFGALDRGMFHTGLRPTESQQERAQAYRSYVTGALQNRCLVGTHWFQYQDQATTGRGDGENYQIGLVDICDRPYPETILAVRQVGEAIYATRAAASGLDGPGFRALFDGKTLSDWKGQPGWWQAEPPAIVSESTPERPCERSHYLVWTGGEPADFDFRCSYRITGDANSGIQFRSQSRPDWDTWGYQADIDAAGVYTGCLYQHERGLVAERGQRVQIDPAGNKTIDVFADSEQLLAAVRPDDWNDYRILAQGPRIQLWINGLLMCEVEDHQEKFALPSGIIALQMHQGPPMRVEFKQLRIRLLSQD